MIKCALVIGHKKDSPGAYNSRADLDEFTYNEKLACSISDKFMKNEEISVQMVYRQNARDLPNDINILEPNFIISLHCNAYNKKASGTEVLYYHSSIRSKKMAEILNNNLVGALKLKNRGIRPKTLEDRGGFLLKNTFSPCVIAEPFFLDNDMDLTTAFEKRNELVCAYATAIKEMAEYFKRGF